MLSKVFKRLLFNSIINYFMEKKLFPECRLILYPGIRVSLSCYQLPMRFTKVLTATHWLILKEHF